MRSWLSLERKAWPSEKGGREVWARSYISTWASRILQGGGRQSEVWLAVPMGGSKEGSLGVTPRCDAALRDLVQGPAPLQGYMPPCTVLPELLGIPLSPQDQTWGDCWTLGQFQPLYLRTTFSPKGTWKFFRPSLTLRKTFLGRSRDLRKFSEDRNWGWPPRDPQECFNSLDVFFLWLGAKSYLLCNFKCLSLTKV